METIPNAPRILYARPQRWAMTHCACAVDGRSLAPASPPPLSGLWRQSAHIHSASLPQEHTLLFDPMGDAGVVVLNRPALQLFQTYRQPRHLDSEPAHTMARLGLLQPWSQPAPRPAPSPRSHTLTAWLHLTNACNLACTYCFVRKNDQAMSPQVGLAAVDAVFRSAQKEGFRAVKLKYAGGEPTLNFDLIRTLHARAHHLSQQHSIELQEVILSNGVALTADMLAFMQANDITLSISLDGLDEGHNAQRIFPTGQGSAHQVRKGIDRAIEHGVKPHLSITVTRHNVDALPRVAAFALERELYFNVNFYLEHMPERDHEALQAENKRLIAGLRRTLAVIAADLPPYNIFTSLLDRTNLAGAHTRACGAGDSYLVIDHHGQVARCQMEMHSPVTDIWVNHPLGDIHDFRPGSGQPAFLDVDEKKACASCPWRYICGGGCTMMTQRLHGEADAPSPYCSVYKTILPEIMQLEGMRLLKWGNEDGKSLVA